MRNFFLSPECENQVVTQSMEWQSCVSTATTLLRKVNLALEQENLGVQLTLSEWGFLPLDIRDRKAFHRVIAEIEHEDDLPSGWLFDLRPEHALHAAKGYQRTQKGRRNTGLSIVGIMSGPEETQDELSPMQDKHGILAELAKKHLWWPAPKGVTGHSPDRIIAQVMDKGNYTEYRLLERAFGVDRIKEIIRHAQPGWFNEKSWYFWHYRLNLCELGKVPPLPARSYAKAG